MIQKGSREYACLSYLADKMEATPRMIGEAVADKPTTPRGYAIIGGKVASNLRWHQDGTLVTHLPDLNAWRITAAGREYLAKVSA